METSPRSIVDEIPTIHSVLENVSSSAAGPALFEPGDEREDGSGSGSGEDEGGPEQEVESGAEGGKDEQSEDEDEEDDEDIIEETSTVLPKIYGRGSHRVGRRRLTDREHTKAISSSEESSGSEESE